jgi:hypothetical protein
VKKPLAFAVALLLSCASVVSADTVSGVINTDNDEKPGVVTSFTFNGFHQPLQDDRDDAQSIGSIQVFVRHAHAVV